MVYVEQVIWWNRFYNYWYTHQDWETITYNYTITDGLNLTVPFNATSSDWVFISVYASNPNQEYGLGNLKTLKGFYGIYAYNTS